MSAITLGVFGIDKRDQYGLGIAFRRHDTNEYVIDSSSEPDIVLIDGDALGAPEAIAAELARQPRRPILVLALIRQYGLDSEAARILTKPVNVNDTLAALDDLATTVGSGDDLDPGDSAASSHDHDRDPAVAALLSKVEDIENDRTADTFSGGVATLGPAGQRERIETKATPFAARYSDYGTTSDRPIESLREAGEQLMSLIADQGKTLAIPATHATERYQPGQHLDGCLAAIVAAAHKLGRSTALVDDGDGVRYDPQTRTFASTGYFDWLDELAQSGRPCAQYMVDDATGLFVARHTSRTFASVLWRAALHSSRGRLRSGIDTNDGLRLRYWPNMTKLERIDGAVPILAAVSAKSPSIDDLLRDGHEPHTVNATINALAAINALVFSPELQAAWHATHETPSRSLIDRLLKRSTQ